MYDAIDVKVNVVPTMDEIEERMYSTKENNVNDTDNTCYECGLPCSSSVHFCTKECKDVFKARFETLGQMLNALTKLTKSRKSNGYPHHRGF